jgi:sugar lactone lactonase YvrE
LANVWVADSYNNRIQEFTSSGTYITQFGTTGTGNGQFDAPIGVAIDGSGNVWVADFHNNRVQEFSPVPEPSSFVLLGIGAVLVTAYRRANRRLIATRFRWRGRGIGVECWAWSHFRCGDYLPLSH